MNKKKEKLKKELLIYRAYYTIQKKIQQLLSNGYQNLICAK